MIQCRFENGRQANLRHVTVKALTVGDNNKVLLVKRALNLLRGGKYDLPGGFLERDEDTQGCALRELFEETGIRGEILFLFRINDSPKRPNEDRQNVDFIYVVKPLSGEIKKDPETLSVSWVSPDNLPPEAEFAFDHKDSILRYLSYLEKPFPLPILG
ncbi:MAG: NUDIX hydrolase [Candidatus Levybacteria bacterium]|nr:NUDIX hydrolase [Candidatus Levybacteria bacterium]MBI2189917.1 NUDIX hydrolase [Candidatus Levybacteria bacterium]MBI3069852.1 NUDIX hydrolase [Candidatus Levybacteria bacterium]MBI3093042.1 NUDIX hydrolase [Candidatus Levybacteria bacterium]